LKDKYYSIGKVSEICNIPIKTLRYYDKINVMVPNLRQENNNYRYYSHDQMVRLFIIKRLRYLGFSLEEVKNILKENDIKNIEVIVEEKRNTIKAEIDELNKKYEEAATFKNKIHVANMILENSGNYNVDNSFRLERQREVYVFGKTAMMQSYKNENVNLEKWIDIIEAAKERNLNIQGDILVSYHTEMFGQFINRDCEVEFSIVVENNVEDVEVKKFGGFLAANAIHVGEYSDIIHTYISLKRWIEEKSLVVNGPVTERFMLSPVDLPNTNSHIVKIIVPVKPTI
jgi:Predicted transcriptional regulators